MSDTLQINPLLSLPFRVPFDQIRAEHVEPAMKELLREARQRIDALAADTEPRTFDNTLSALDRITEPLDEAMAVVRHLESVATYPQLRAAYNAVQPEVSAFYSGIPLHAGLWKALQSYSATAEAAALAGTRRRFLLKTVDSFRHHGADLDPAGKARLEAIDIELATVTTKFSENVLDATNAFELVITEESGLAGLPPSAIAAARESAAQKGLAGWRFTLQAPSYTPVMTYLDDAGIRREIYHAYAIRSSSGKYDNRAVLSRILELRRAKAELLGFRNFADFVLHDRMAHSGERAELFLKDLKRKTEGQFARENRELLEFRRGLEGPDAPALQPWDVAYYAEKQRVALYDFDEEALRPYFPLESVVDGLFEIVRRLYGVRVSADPGVPSWDPQVRYFAVYDGEENFVGGFYADWYPRENKRGGAWMDALMTGYPAPEDLKPHLGLICGNLTPPLADRPALLTHREVATIFHEFGHLLHHLLSRVEVRSLAGTNVAWDFVELPSQIMETGVGSVRHWTCSRATIRRARRSPTTFSRRCCARAISAAPTRRCASLASASWTWRCTSTILRSATATRSTTHASMLQQYSPAPLPPDHAMIAGFTHLFSSPVGYGAGYYSYKWAEVLDADAFTRFRTRGIFSSGGGGEFRDKILARGDSEDPAELYRAFMGRDPDPNALLERSGLLQ